MVQKSGWETEQSRERTGKACGVWGLEKDWMSALGKGPVWDRGALSTV